MKRPKGIWNLTALFQKLGAHRPEEWAASEVEEGINQLGRYLFLRQAWACVVSENDHSWIDAQIDRARKDPTAPGAGVGLALERLIAGGATEADLTDMARGLQWEVLHCFCNLLSDPSLEEEEVQGFAWGLFEVDEDGQPIAPIDMLHESVLETDPTGREMRPRADPK